MKERPKRDWSAAIGAAQLAIGRTEGIARFGDTPRAFLASLAPLVAFSFVTALSLIAQSGAADALATFFLSLVVQLAPPVLSHALAVRWDRESSWLRYATAFNWCQWIVVAAVFVSTQVLDGTGLSDEAVGQMVVVVVGCYGLFLHWLLARHGLKLGIGRSVLLLILVNLGTAALILAPPWIGVLVTG